MVLFGLEKCVFQPQIWRRVKLRTYTRNYSIRDNSNQYIPMPQLMSFVDIIDPIPNEYRFFSYLKFAYGIDREFDAPKFRDSINMALDVVSSALAKRDYKSLEGLVCERALKVLKHRLNNFTPEQRKLISLKGTGYHYPKELYYPAIVKPIGANTVIVDIIVKKNYIVLEDGEINNFLTYVLSKIAFFVPEYSCTYVFRRKYIEGKGGPWIIRRLNYSGPVLPL